MKDKVFYVTCFGFLAGVFLRSFLFFDTHVIFWLIAVSAIIIFFNFVVFKNRWGTLIGILILAFSLGGFRFHLVDKSFVWWSDSQFNDKIQSENKVNLFGEIVDDPEIRESNQKIVVLLKDTKKNVKILITTSLSERYKYGDLISFSGFLQKPENFITDQGKEFDYINYLRKDKIFFLSNYPTIEILASGHGNPIKHTLFFVKEKFIQKIDIKIPQPESFLMSGLILGEKSSFDEELKQKFINTGTVHIVALSGYNITIIAEWIMKIFIFLPRNLGIGVGIFAIFLFILMTGASSTAIRAGIMATLALIARATGRNYDVLRALILAGVFMVAWNPFVLVFDVSFQLSFLATIAVIFLAPRFEKHFKWITPKLGLRDIVSVTSAAYVFVLPFVLYKMGNLSLVALPANILILPFIPVTMMFGFLTGIAGIIWFPLLVPFAIVSKILLSYELLVVNFFADLPFSSFIIPNFPLILTIAIYLWFIYFLFGREIKKFFILPN